MKKSNSLFLFISPIIIICAIGSILLIGCYTATSARSFTEADLLIDKSAMPLGWESEEPIEYYPYDKEGADNLALIDFYYSDTPFLVRAGEDVYRFRNQYFANISYSHLVNAYMTQRANDVTPWQTPIGLDFTSSTADRCRFACAENSFSPSPEFGSKARICLYLAQYDEFIIMFRITIEVDNNVFISIDEVKNIIEEIDAKMAQYLNP